MAAGNGFQAVEPDAVYGDSQSEGAMLGQRFTCGGTGAQEVLSIGGYSMHGNGAERLAHFAIFTDDGTWPETMVTNSDSGEYAIPNSWTHVHHHYSTRPVLTGGAAYWLIFISNNSVTQINRFATGGVGVNGNGGFTYPTYPTGAAWHDFGANTRDIAIYAVYQAQAAAASPSSSLCLLGVG